MVMVAMERVYPKSAVIASNASNDSTPDPVQRQWERFPAFGSGLEAYALPEWGGGVDGACRDGAKDLAGVVDIGEGVGVEEEHVSALALGEGA
jgi:hypothetical protein